MIPAHSLSRLRGLRPSLPPSAAGRILMANAFVGSIGTGLFLTGSVLYYTRTVHLSATQVSLGLSLAGLCALLLSVPIGSLADRLGARRVLVGLHAWRVLGYTALALATNYWQFLLVVCAVTVADRAGPAANQAMVGRLFTKEERVRTMAYLRAVRNLGLGLGALLAALALSANTGTAYRLLVLGNAVSFVPMVYLVSSTRRYERPRPAAPATREDPARRAAAPRTPLRDLPFVSLSAANGVLLLHDSILFVALPLWIAGDTHAPRWTISLVLIVNTILTALGQVRWSALVDTLPKAARGLFGAGSILAAAAICFGSAHAGNPVIATVLVLIGAIVFTAGENLHSAASWQASFDLSPVDAQGKYLSVFNLGQSLQDMAGPTVATVLGVESGPIGWFGLAAIFLGSGLTARASATWATRRRNRELRSSHDTAMSPTS